ncbi:MAG: hypothetical protein Q8S41_07125 [Lutibacter sp.]|nr:hypothetical protein [Lutibacter sp.]
MKKNQIIIGIFIIIGLVAILTNPKLQEHKDAVKAKIAASHQKNTNLQEEKNAAYYLGRSFGNLLGDVLIDNIVNTIVSTDNYVLFSLTKVTWDSETKVIGVGLFGNIFFSPKINEKLEAVSLDNNY